MQLSVFVIYHVGDLIVAHVWLIFKSLALAVFSTYSNDMLHHLRSKIKEPACFRKDLSK